MAHFTVTTRGRLRCPSLFPSLERVFDSRSAWPTLARGRGKPGASKETREERAVTRSSRGTKKNTFFGRTKTQLSFTSLLPPSVLYRYRRTVFPTSRPRENQLISVKYALVVSACARPLIPPDVSDNNTPTRAPTPAGGFSRIYNAR